MRRGPAITSGADAAAQMSARFGSADVAVEAMLLGPSGVVSYRVSASARGCESLQILDPVMMIRISGSADRVRRRVG
ncbi:hypothetical protein DY245_11755 [Streptomyces inhibens]|uniref:Uncharacterized protein n=1 Tax=Streptomyces inhibens TaxID=2293571 RepID=A0A371Q657_STRIH|nr:hypothetical protein DY245_11755 [Streptomyces inhibens]